MDDFDVRIKNLLARIKRAQKHMDNLQAEKTELYKECPHTHIERKSYYFSGSYYDKAYTKYWNECTVCGERSEVIMQGHNYYG